MSARDDYVEKMKAQLDNWNAEIAKLEAQSEKARADARLRYEEQLEELRRRRAEFQQKAQEIQRANEDAWRELQSSAEKAWQSMEEGFKNAWARFK